MNKKDTQLKHRADNIADVTFSVEGMSCKSCENKVIASVSKLSGVKDVSANFTEGRVSVRFEVDKIELSRIQKAVEAVGYFVAIGYYVAQNDASPIVQNRESHDRHFSRISKILPYLVGGTAALGVVGFYLGFLTLTSDWYTARMEFSDFRWWILALAAGLGVQATLYSLFRIRRQGGSGMKGATSSLAASGGMSTASMAACCAHYLVAFLPALGLPFLSAAAAGLAQYQTQFFLVGVLSNLFGIGFMIQLMNKNGILPAVPLRRYLTPGYRHQT